MQGIYNVAGDGLLPWSEVAAICGKRTFPLPPFGLGLLSAPLTRLGLDLPPELLDLLRHGRGVDNRRLKQVGFDYRYTSAGTVADFVEALRLRTMAGSTEAGLPVRAGRRAVLPPQPGRRSGTVEETACTSVRTLNPAGSRVALASR